MASRYATGSIKIKNADGELVSFLPVTDTSCVYRTNSTNTVANTLQEFNTKINKLKNSEDIEIMHVEPMEENTQDMFPERMILWYGSTEYDGMKHLSVAVSNDASKTLKVGDTVNFTYYLINDGGE